MLLYYLASVAGLFPGRTLPMGVGWKSLHAFDLLLPACLVFAAIRKAYRPPDGRLVASGLALILAGGLSLWAHPSPEGLRNVISVGYSVTVLLAISHLRLERLGVRADRVILVALFFAIGLGWIAFLTENLLGVSSGRNQSAALPAGVHRFGGLTGGNTLILFICLAGPLARTHLASWAGVILPAIATLSRSVLGVGLALLLHPPTGSGSGAFARRATGLAAAGCVALGLGAYAFAVVPVDPSKREPFRISLDAGGYLTPHQAALRMFASSPVLGVGPAQFVDAFKTSTSEEERRRLARPGIVKRAPHSAVLGLIAEQGLVGLAAFTWLIFEIYRRVWRIADADLRGAAIAGLTGLLAGGHFVDWFPLKGLWLWIGLLVASRPEKVVTTAAGGCSD